VISRFRLLRIKHNESNCTKCNLCFEVCPEVQVLNRIGRSSGTIDMGACTSCARCIEICDDNALKFSFSGRSNKN